MGKTKRLVFLASGLGSNFSACMEFLQKKALPVKVLGLISDNPAAKALEKAKSFQIPSFVLPFSEYQPKEKYHEALLETLRKLSPDLIVACGYMRILKPNVIREFPKKILNIHPSLLPSFPGLHAQKQALDSGVKVSGCTVHFVDEGVDTGPILLQKAVPIDPNWGERELSLAILKEEHMLLPLAIQYFCENKLQWRGKKVEIVK